jgi:branched-chain amino acid transport system substrate-binding protein
MPRSLAQATRLSAVLVAVLLIVAACSNSSGTPSGSSGGSSGGGGGATDVGVTSSEIQIGGLASATGPLADQYSPIWQAVQAYLDNVNSHGGVNGRKIVYTAKLDDGLSPSNDVTQARALVEQDNVFAVVGVATPSFAGGPYLAQKGVPTFGWNINAEWSSGPSLFGQNGSYIDFTNPGPGLSWLIKHVGGTKAAIMAYGVQQSAQCADGDQTAFNKYGINVVLKDTSLPFGVQDLSSDISRLKSSGANFATTCMDPGGNVILSKGLQQTGIYNGVKQYWPNGYDAKTLAGNYQYMQNVYLDTNGTVPYVKGYSQGMDQYLDAMNSRHIVVGPVTLAGWINANLFVTALQHVGSDVTRAKVVNYINGLKNYTANGIISNLDWTTAHRKSVTPTCTAWVQVRGQQFVPVFGSSKQDPYVCWKSNYATTTNPIPYSQAFPSNVSALNG